MCIRKFVLILKKYAYIHKVEVGKVKADIEVESYHHGLGDTLEFQDFLTCFW